MATVRSVVDMPLKSSKAAPEKFKGHHNDVRDFVEHYEKLLAINNVTADEEKCKAIRTYCSRSVKEVIESMPGYLNQDWDSLKNDLLKYYNADKSDQRFSEKDLTRFARSHREKDIKSIYEFRKYIRRYIRIAGWLRSKEKISDREYNKNLWKGLPRSLKRRLEARITSKKPGVNLADPFDAQDVIEAAEYVLKPDRFDESSSESSSENDSGNERKMSKKGKLEKKKVTRERMNKRKDSRRRRSRDSSSNDDSDIASPSSRSSESEDESESSNEEAQRVTKRSVKKQVRFPKDGKIKRARGSLTRAEVREMEEKLEDKQEAASKYDEVENLIARMARMGLDDPQYAALYYRATKLDEKVREQLIAPVHRNAPQIAATRPLRAPTPTPNAGRPPINASAATYPNSIPLARSPAAAAASGCFGCGKAGHRVNECEEIRKLEGNGVIRRDENGRYVLTDGGRIHRAMGEPIAAAVQKMFPKVNYIGTEDRALAMVAESETDETVEEGYDETRVYASQRTERPMAKGARREVFDGVYIRPVKKTASPEQKETGAEKSSKSPKPEPQNRRQFKKASSEGLKAREIPVETRGPSFDPEDDDAIMEDVSKPAEGQKTGLGAKASGEKKKSPPSAKVSDMTNLEGLFKRILDAQIPVSIGELTGVSKEIRTHLLDALKAKRAAVVGSAGVLYQAPSKLRPKLKYNHIRVQIKYKDQNFKGIIDTGAHMNIMGPEMYEALRSDIPIDTSEALMMRDINGGQSRLLGAVLNVPIDLGGARTFADFYVSPGKMDFEVLLGRPWQRHNYVSILEHPETGTWLKFLYPEPLVDKAPKEVMLNVSPASGKLKQAQTNKEKITEIEWESMRLIRQLLYRERVLANALEKQNDQATIEETEESEIYAATLGSADSSSISEASNDTDSLTYEHSLAQASTTLQLPIPEYSDTKGEDCANINDSLQSSENIVNPSVGTIVCESESRSNTYLLENSGGEPGEECGSQARPRTQRKGQSARAKLNQGLLPLHGKILDGNTVQRSEEWGQRMTGTRALSDEGEIIPDSEDERNQTTKPEPELALLSYVSSTDANARTDSDDAQGKLELGINKADAGGEPFAPISVGCMLAKSQENFDALRVQEHRSPHEPEDPDGESQALKRHLQTSPNYIDMSSQDTTRSQASKAEDWSETLYSTDEDRDMPPSREEYVDAITMTQLYPEELQLRGDEVVMIAHGWDDFGEYFQFQCHNASLVLPRAVLDYLTGLGRVDYGHSVIRWYPTPPTSFEGLSDAPIPLHFDYLPPPFSLILNANALDMAMRPAPSPPPAAPLPNKGPNAHLGGLVIPATFRDEEVSVSLRSVPGYRNFEFLMPEDCVPAHLNDLRVRAPATYYPPQAQFVPTPDPRQRPSIASLIEPPRESVLFAATTTQVSTPNSAPTVKQELTGAPQLEIQDKAREERVTAEELDRKIAECRQEVQKKREYARVANRFFGEACEMICEYNVYLLLSRYSEASLSAENPFEEARELMQDIDENNSQANLELAIATAELTKLLQRRASMSNNKTIATRPSTPEPAKHEMPQPVLSIDPALLYAATPARRDKHIIGPLHERIERAEDVVENAKARLRNARELFEETAELLGRQRSPFDKTAFSRPSEHSPLTFETYHKTLMELANEEERALRTYKEATSELYNLCDEREELLGRSANRDEGEVICPDVDMQEEDRDALGHTDTEDEPEDERATRPSTKKPCLRCLQVHGAVECPEREKDEEQREKHNRIYAASVLSDGTSEDDTDVMDTEDDDELELYDTAIAFTSDSNDRYVIVEHPRRRHTFTARFDSERSGASRLTRSDEDRYSSNRRHNETRHFGRTGNAEALGIDAQIFAVRTPEGLRRTYSLPPIDTLRNLTPPSTPSPQGTSSGSSSLSRNRAHTFEDRVLERLQQLQENIENVQVTMAVFHRLTRDEQQRIGSRVEEVSSIIRYLLIAIKTLTQGIACVDKRIGHGLHDIIDHYLRAWDEERFGGIGRDSFRTGRCETDPDTMVAAPPYFGQGNRN
jgi:hypothetical protein